ncbi:MAG: hypothetical protein LBS69_05190 [Prevotellaceae bacterium]|jgi:RHS repeat-associated protein|nr:hypothetical protein [Prevotellaceae bacterium]
MKNLALITLILAFAANAFAAGAGIAGGRIQKTSTGYEINYYITDLLGSTRVIVGSNGEVKEQNDYYPFGMRHVNSNLMTSTNRYTFSGKERQTTAEINYMDFGSRMYDDFLGRWFTHDPQSYRRPWETPYGYCGNNPVFRVDKNGQFWFLAAAVGFIVNYVSHGISTHNWGLKAIGQGLIGAATSLIGYGIGTGVAGSLIANGMSSGLAGVISSGVGGFYSGTFNSAFRGGNPLQGGLIGLGTGLFGGLTSTLKINSIVGQGLYHTAAGGVSGGLASVAMRGKFWNGFRDGAIGSTVGWVVDRAVRYMKKTANREAMSKAEKRLNCDELTRAEQLESWKDPTQIYQYDGEDQLATWNELTELYKETYPDQNLRATLSIDFGDYKTIKFNELHIRWDGSKVTYHYDYYDIGIQPVKHIRLDSWYQGKKYDNW